MNHLCRALGRGAHAVGHSECKGAEGRKSPGHSENSKDVNVAGVLGGDREASLS